MDVNQPKPVPGLEPTSLDYGNLEDLSKAGSLHEFLMELHAKFGPIASFWWGKIFTVSIASAELFDTQKDLFDRPEDLFELLSPLFEPKCIHFANKEEGLARWQHYRKSLTEEAVKGYLPQFQEVADELANKWSELLDEPAIPVMRFTSLLSLKAILHTLFGNLMKDERDELNFRSEADEVWSEIELSFNKPRTAEREKRLQDGKAWRMLVDSRGLPACVLEAESGKLDIKRREPDKKDLEDLIKKMFEERRNTPPMKGKETLVDHILSFTDDPEVHLADGLEFTTAGLYTIEALITYAMFYIATHPDVEEKLCEEMQTVLGEKNVDGESMENLRFLRQVLDETLRCSVFGMFAARFQDVDSKLGGYNIPKNTPVILALGVAMKNGEIWQNPDMFNPDRFTNANQQEREKSWFSPFGVGRRECLAREFTYGVTVVTMVTLLRKFKFHVVDETEAHNPVDENEAHNPVWGLSTHHHEEVLMRLSRR